MQIAPSSLASMFSATATPKAGGMTSAGASLLNSDSTAGVDSARGQFDSYMKKTPAEKMHAAMLKRLGLTEEQLKAMAPEERAAVEAKIKDMIKQEIEASTDKKKTGLFADVKV